MGYIIEDEEGSEELDGLVAEKVMGWRREDFWPVSDQREDRSKPCVRWFDSAGALHFRAPAYSTTLEDAWKVAEHAANEVRIQYNGSAAMWGCVFHSHVFDKEPAVMAWTAPLAICYAALLYRRVWPTAHEVTNQ